MSSSSKAKRAAELTDRIKPILAGEGPDVQSAVLADLLSMWLAGHVGLSLAAKLDLLDEHLRLVAKLLPVNEEMIHVSRLQ